MLIGGNASILYLFLLNAAFRGAGDAPVALRSLALANGLNLVLDPCFIFGLGPFPELGVTGAAVATTIGRGGLRLPVLVPVRRPGPPRVPGAQPGAFAVFDRTPGPGFIGGIGQFLIATSSWILVIRIIAMGQRAPVAAYTIAIRMIEFRFFSPPARQRGGHHGGPEPGRRPPDRAEAAVVAARCNVLFMTTLGGVFFVFAPQIVGLFSDDVEILRYGTHCLRILGLGYPMYAVGMIITQALNGAGDTPHALDPEPDRLLADPDPTGLRAGCVPGPGPERRVLGDRHFRIPVVRAGRAGVPPRRLAFAAGLSEAAGATKMWVSNLEKMWVSHLVVHGRVVSAIVRTHFGNTPEPHAKEPHMPARIPFPPFDRRARGAGQRAWRSAPATPASEPRNRRNPRAER